MLNSSFIQANSHHPYIPIHLKDFIVEDPYNHKPPHTLDSFPYEPTFYKLHLVWVLLLHQLEYSTMDQIVYRSLRKIAYGKKVFLNFYVLHKRTCSCRVCWCLFNWFYSEIHLGLFLDFLDHLTPFLQGTESPYLVLSLYIFCKAFQFSEVPNRSVLFWYFSSSSSTPVFLLGFHTTYCFIHKNSDSIPSTFYAHHEVSCLLLYPSVSWGFKFISAVP